MNNPNNAIEVKNVKKYFKVYYDKGATLKDKLSARIRSSYQKREVLKGLSFEVKKGEAIGLIGKNGCGKSTTLKLLTKIIYPNEGSVEMNGRVSSLLELGAGFHPDMSGIENIYMNAAVFGLSKREIDKRVDDIIKFSELQEFIDNPIRTYSSGMYMRLAFSVAINVDADILLIDEILAVGDVSFQKKCFEKLKEIKMDGTTIVIVSHSLDQIREICDRTIWIEDGVIKEEGKPGDVHEHYLYEMEKDRLCKMEKEYFSNEEIDEDEILEKETEALEAEQDVQKNANSAKEVLGEIYSRKNMINKESLISRRGNGEVRIVRANITDAEDKQTMVLETGQDFDVYICYEARRTGLKGVFGLEIFRDDGIYCYGSTSFIENQKLLDFGNKGCICIHVKNNVLLPGRYFMKLGLHDENASIFDTITKAVEFRVFAKYQSFGVCKVDGIWEHIK